MAIGEIAKTAAEGLSSAAENKPSKIEVPGTQDATEKTAASPERYDGEIRDNYGEITGNAESDITKIDTINSPLEGKKHPVTDVPFTGDTVELPDGKVIEGVFPEFDPIAETQLASDENGEYKGTRADHETAANNDLKEQVANNPELREKFTAEQLEQIENGDTPDGYTWHHHQEPGKMQLVDQKTHAATGHTGGYSLWGEK